ncbi:MAG: YjbQ family protein [Hadesarchaea archaeon]|nr:YjbQ family protein [Hadesarchaea archaeon]
MKTWSREFSISTGKQCEVIDVTDKVISAVRESGIKNGLLLVLLPHATATLVLNEDEGGLKQDLLNRLDDLVPKQGNYHHDRIDDNAHAHLKSALFGSIPVLPIINGRLVRGTWQNFLLIEQDGPRTRRMVVFAMGE